MTDDELRAELARLLGVNRIEPALELHACNMLCARHKVEVSNEPWQEQARRLIQLTTTNKAMKTKLLLSACALALLTGCAQFILPSPAQLKELAQDKNSIKVRVVTIYGTMDLERNVGTNSSVFSPDTAKP